MESQASRQPRVTLSDAHKAFIRDQVEPLRRVPLTDPQWQRLHQVFVAKFRTLQRKPTLRQYKYEAVTAMHHSQQTLRRDATVSTGAGLRHGPRSHNDDLEEVAVTALGQVGDAIWRGGEDEDLRAGEEEEEGEDDDEDRHDEQMETTEGRAKPDAAHESHTNGEDRTTADAEKLRERVAMLEAQHAWNEREAQEWKALFEATRIAGQDLKRDLLKTKAALRAKDELLNEQKKVMEYKDAQVLELQKLLMQAQQQFQEAQNSACRFVRPADSRPSQPLIAAQAPRIDGPSPESASAAAPVAVQPQTAINGVTLAINVQLDRLLGSHTAP